MELSVYIGELLKEHNCVIVPEFGGFIANYRSAIINRVNNRITPPSKSVLFNPNLINNDGLLGNYVAQKRTESYANAIAFINENVKEWKAELAAGGRVNVGEVGFLYKQDDRIVFEQNREVNLLLNAYGLTSISFVNFAEKPVEKESELIPTTKLEVEKPTVKIPVTQEKETVVIALQSEASIEEEKPVETDQKVIPIQPRKRKTYRYLAVAAALPILFYAYWIPMETDFIDTGKIQMADFNPIKSSPERTYQSRNSTFETVELIETTNWEDLTSNLSDNVAIYNYHFDDELYIPIRLDKTATDLQKTTAIENTVKSEENSNLEFHIIGGCFSIKENADNLVKDLIAKGYPAKVFDFKGGLYRVTAGDFSNRSAANENLQSFKNDGFSGWILKK